MRESACRDDRLIDAHNIEQTIMAPSKASKSAASGRPTLRQSSLSFTSKRTTAAGSDAKGKTSRKSSTVPSTPRPVSPQTPADESSEDDTEKFEPGVPATEDVEERPVKRRKLVRKDAVAAESESLQPKPRRLGTGVFRSREGVENADGGKTHREDEERPRLNVNDKRWRKQYGEARDKMGNSEPSKSAVLCCLVLSPPREGISIHRWFFYEIYADTRSRSQYTENTSRMCTTSCAFSICTYMRVLRQMTPSSHSRSTDPTNTAPVLA